MEHSKLARKNTINSETGPKLPFTKNFAASKCTFSGKVAELTEVSLKSFGTRRPQLPWLVLKKRHGSNQRKASGAKEKTE